MLGIAESSDHGEEGRAEPFVKPGLRCLETKIPLFFGHF